MGLVIVFQRPLGLRLQIYAMAKGEECFKLKSDRSHVVLGAKELGLVIVFLRPLGLPRKALPELYSVWVGA